MGISGRLPPNPNAFESPGESRICVTGNTCRGSIQSRVPPLPPSAQQDKSELTLPCLASLASDNGVGGSNKSE